MSELVPSHGVYVYVCVYTYCTCMLPEWASVEGNCLLVQNMT